MAAKLGLPALLVAGGPVLGSAGRPRLLPGRQEGPLQIEYGLLTDPAGRPVAVRVFPGNTGDPAAFTAIADVIRDKFGLGRMVMVGDRGMITSARIAALNRLEDGTARPDPYGWITALRAPAIRKLMAEDGPLQLSLFDEQDLAEITSPDFPGERLVACRNPALAADRARKREDLLAATEQLLAPVIARVRAGRLAGAAAIGVEAGKVISKYKTGKHFTMTITEDSLAIERDQARIDAEAALDGFYVLRTPVPADELDAPAVVAAYKNLARVERDFRSIKSDDLDLRPVFHRLEERVKAHVLICMLACYLTWHLRQAWASLTFTDEHPARPGQPGRPGPPLRCRPGQGLTPARSGRPSLPQLPRPDRPPGHPDPQPGPVHRRRRRRPDAHRADQHPAPGLHPDRRPHPAHLDVASPSSSGMVATRENPGRCGSRRAGAAVALRRVCAAWRACGVGWLVRAARDAGCSWDAIPLASLALGS
jgi:hypothetical protein